MILDRPFMKTAKVILDVDKGEVRVRSQEDEVRFNLFDDVTNYIADKDGRQKEISKDGEQMEGSKPKEKIPPQEKLEAKGDQNNQGKPMEEDVYWPGQPIMLNAGRGKGMKNLKKLWVTKELKLNGTIEVEKPFARKTKVITKALAK